MKPDLDKVVEEGVSPICTRSAADQFLGNVVQLREVHEHFLTSLERVTSPFPFHTNLVGDVFLQSVSRSLASLVNSIENFSRLLNWYMC